jgi:LPXTG-motif cell wall-anchored protein
LAAAGPTPISGSTGSGAVTAAAVSAGRYSLTEADGPAGYTAGAWSCTGATVDGAAVIMSLGADVTCTIDNDDQPVLLPPDLPKTGADLLASLWWAGLMLLLGTAALVLSQRRRVT